MNVGSCRSVFATVYSLTGNMMQRNKVQLLFVKCFKFSINMISIFCQDIGITRLANKDKPGLTLYRGENSTDLETRDVIDILLLILSTKVGGYATYVRG